MTEKDKQLLLQDLCCRLPYIIKVDYTEKYPGWNSDMAQLEDNIAHIPYRIGVDESQFMFENIESIKPYLRPMSSMTDEEREAFRIIGGVLAHNIERDTYAIAAFTPEAYDWLISHYFDFHGLIEKGLALEAPEDTYTQYLKNLD